jgi:holo-[acyl-carrier protein] synthase
VYREDELRECGARPRQLAARFAAKEAAIKALGAADVAAPWRSISVRCPPGRADRLVLTGAVQEVAERRGVSSLQLSLSQQPRCAVAVVLARCNDD